MKQPQYYRILLDDYSAASFTSFNKAYFGTMQDLEGWIKAIEDEECFAERFSALTSTFHIYQTGQHTVTHIGQNTLSFHSYIITCFARCYVSPRRWRSCRKNRERH